MIKSNIPILFCEHNSVYFSLSNRVYTSANNALNYPGGEPGVYHPPCRLWSRMRAFSTANHDEKILGIWSVIMVRKYGGVLEQPYCSTLFKTCGLPLPGSRDAFGGYVIDINQSWFGHPCRKRTWLYIVGLTPAQLPDFSPNYEPHRYTIGHLSSYKGNCVVVAKKWRSRTPLAFAQFLIAIATKIKTNGYTPPIGLSYLPELKQ